MSGPTTGFVPGPVRVRVPATTANLGAGYDALGLALTHYDTLTGEVLDEPGLVVEVAGEGAGDVPLDERHLVVRVMRRAFAALGVEPVGLRLACDNAVPHGRGLGSSSAAIVGGLALARALVADGDARMDDDALFALAAEIEGHPDNVAPAVYGGLTVSWHEDSGFRAVRLDVALPVRCVVLVPPTPLETAVARGLLPASVPHGDAAFNLGRAALAVAALAVAGAGTPDLLLAATEDRLHQGYRAPAMPESAALIAALRADGIPAMVSGAGPTVLALVDATRVDAVLAATPAGWWSADLSVDVDGVRVLA